MKAKYIAAVLTAAIIMTGCTAEGNNSRDERSSSSRDRDYADGDNFAEESEWSDVSESPDYDFEYREDDGGIFIVKYIGNAPRVKIPAKIGGKKVAAVEPQAFARLDKLTAVYIPPGVREIGAMAFAMCPNLESVYIGKNVKTIGNMAFVSCDNLTVTFNGKSYTGDEIKELYTKTPESPSESSDTSDPADTREYDKNASPESDFDYVTDAGDIVITEYKGAGGHVAIPSTINGAKVTGIFGSAFAGCQELTSVVLPVTLNHISGAAFADCYNLTELTALGSELHVSGQCFDRCGFTSLVFPKSIKLHISGQCFINCDDLKEIVFEGDNSEISGQCFMKNEALERVVISGDLIIISGQCFMKCDKLKEVIISGNSAVDKYCFEGSKNVTVRYGGKTYSYSEREQLFNDIMKNLGAVSSSTPPSSSSRPADPEPTVSYAPASDFKYNTADGRAYITGYKGNDVNVSIPPTIDGCSVYYIGACIFGGNLSVKTVTVPDSVMEIADGRDGPGESAFNGCNADVIYKGKTYKNSWEDMEKLYHAINVSEEGTTNGFEWKVDRGNLHITKYSGTQADIIVPSNINGKSVDYIDMNTFCSPSINSIIFSEGFTKINHFAIRDCPNLTKVSLPQKTYMTFTQTLQVFPNCPKMQVLYLGKTYNSSNYSELENLLFEIRAYQ